MIYEALHQSALFPLVALFIWGRKLGAPYWLLGVSFFVSWIGDSMADLGGRSWALSYAWIPFQIGFALWAFLDTLAQKAMAFWAVLAVALASVMLTGPDPELLLTMTGSLAIMVLARGRLAFPTWIYFGFGTTAYVFMALRRHEPGFMPAWIAYQGCRVAAYVMFAAVVIAQSRRAYVADRD